MRLLTLVTIALPLLISGCLEVDNQDLATPAQKAKVNPAPSNRDFKAINRNHKILIAILDTGTDYNHPGLIQNIHFDLDDSGRPTGTGWDYLGKDSWPSPYIARTIDVDPSAPAKDRLRSATVRNILAGLIKEKPELAKYFDPDRSVELEQWAASHGTHVSGLASQQDSRIGILPYRVALLNKDFSLNLSKEDLVIELNSRSAAQIRAALSHAIQKGAQVINLSLALANGKSEKSRQAFAGWFAEMKNFIDSNPGIVFIAAAGNDSIKNQPKFVVNTENQLPCGIPSPNVLCVTAIDQLGIDTWFTSMPVPELVQLKALGDEVPSSVPTLFCKHEYIRMFTAEEVNPLPQSILKVWAPEILKECSPAQTAVLPESGTSMSAPIAAYEIAKILIENPKLNGQQAIEALRTKFPQGVSKLSGKAF